MTIHFQYHSLFLTAPGELSSDFTGIVMDDSDLSACFEALVQSGQDVAVRMKNASLRLWAEYVKKHYICVKAAGGVVFNGDGLRLLMTRNGRADLPKGKVEEGETLAQAALRETQEETGLSCLQLGGLLLKTYHIYDLYGGWHFKQTSWFSMRAEDGQRLVPQTEEGISDLLWLPEAEWRSSLRDSYATMKLIAGSVD